MINLFLYFREQPAAVRAGCRRVEVNHRPNRAVLPGNLLQRLLQVFLAHIRQGHLLHTGRKFRLHRNQSGREAQHHHFPSAPGQFGCQRGHRGCAVIGQQADCVFGQVIFGKIWLRQRLESDDPAREGCIVRSVTIASYSPVERSRLVLRRGSPGKPPHPPGCALRQKPQGRLAAGPGIAPAARP